ncbi:AI-2E family transporter [Odoribacter lunatus]|uniref:AI-2E family transporter n=1 Tax=Odoribacter lunatus TaxID=2941335 RepID=UPI00203D20EC|nr:AI-2E family transporter [Odoribacter lunatus]
MNNSGKYVLGLVVLCLVVFACWYFSSVIAYVLIAAVVSFIGRPLVNWLGRIEIRGIKLPSAVKAALTLGLLWAVFIFFFITVIPLVINEFRHLSDTSVEQVVLKLEAPLEDMGNTLSQYGAIDRHEDVKRYVSDNLVEFVSGTRIKSFFGTVAGTVSGLVVAFFSITFIAFFFLKDRYLFSRIILALLPARYEESGQNALDSIQKLLVRYFGGMFVDVISIMTLNTIGLSLVGLNFSHAIVVGVVSGVLNVIPYIGPLIGILFGMVVGIVSNMELPFYSEVFPLLIYMVVAMFVTQVVDSAFLQPFIYGNSVHAHPLEIFLVILMAGSIAGIPGMILAIPSYTVLRVILKEFFNKYRLVKKLTQSLEH